MNYDFDTLSPWEFEQLARDLLREELGLDFESFKDGKDQGIDLRYSEEKTNRIIVQCKNYSGSTFSNLKSNLKNIELSKIRNLNPDRYILVTSLGLTPRNKNEIAEILGDYLLSYSDIVTRQTLNSWLKRNPKIERDCISLWAGSTAVLERVFHSGIFNYAQAQMDDLRTRLQYYVKTPSFYEAKNILKEQRYCIIAGIPGIGKTTLAEILLIDYMRDGYEPIKISSDIEEAFDVYDPNTKRIYYYDDFLGQTGLDQKLNKNEEQRILDFCRLIKKSKKSLFVLTTREYILNQAKKTYEKLSNSNFDLYKCVIDISSYKLMDRAIILYNHLYFSGIGSEYLKEITKNENYLKIISHESFNPRIIEWMTDHLYVMGVSSKCYVSSFISRLDNPYELWEHAYKNQISLHTKNMLLVLSSVPSGMLLNDFKGIFDNFRSMFSEKYNVQRVDNEFLMALKEGEGNFVRLDIENNHQVIGFHNPSIRDYMTYYLSNDRDLLVLLIRSCNYFDQLITIWNSFDSLENNLITHDAEMAYIYQEQLIKLVDTDSVRYWLFSVTSDLHHKQRRIKRYIFILNLDMPLFNEEFKRSINTGLNSIFSDLDGIIDWSDIVDLLKGMHSKIALYGIEFQDALDATVDIMLDNLNQINDYKQLSVLYKEYSSCHAKIDCYYEFIKDKFDDDFDDEVSYASSDHDASLLEDIVNDLQDIDINFDFELNSRIQELNDMVDEIIRHDLNNSYEEDYTPSKNTNATDDIDDIRSLFKTL